MISRRKFIQGLTLTAAGLLIPETISRVFYSIPKVVVPQNLTGENAYEFWHLRTGGREYITLEEMKAMFDKCCDPPQVPNYIFLGPSGGDQLWLKL